MGAFSLDHRLDLPIPSLFESLSTYSVPGPVLGSGIQNLGKAQSLVHRTPCVVGRGGGGGGWRTDE